MRIWLEHGYWTLLGLVVGWIWWRVPDHIASIRQWKANRIQAEIARIEGAFIPDSYTPLVPPPLPYRDRILEYWRQWKEDTHPRSPEEIARIAYSREVGTI